MTSSSVVIQPKVTLSQVTISSSANSPSPLRAPFLSHRTWLGNRRAILAHPRENAWTEKEKIKKATICRNNHCSWKMLLGSGDKWCTHRMNPRRFRTQDGGQSGGGTLGLRRLPGSPAKAGSQLSWRPGALGGFYHTWALLQTF